MGEILGLRTKNSKTFDHGRGRFTLTCGGDISHFQTESGWEDTDFTFNDIAPTGWTHYYSKNEWRVLVDRFKGRIAILPDRSDDTKYILFRAHPTSNITISVEELDKQHLHCWRVGPNEAYHFIISPQGIKPYVFLYNESAVTSWTIGFTLNNLTRVGREIFDGERKLGTLPNAWLQDADGTIRDVTESINADTATISWDHSGLTFPVTVDPTISIQPSSKDSELNANIPTTNLGGNTAMDAGTGAGTLARRPILAMDFSALPDSAVIGGATLTLFYAGFLGDDPVGRTVTAYRLTQTGWVENQCTWNVYATGSAWTTPGGDFTATDSATAVYPAAAAFMNWNVLSQVRYWQDNGKTAHFLMRDEMESGSQSAGIFSTKESGTPSARPAMTIYYELLDLLYKHYTSVALIGRMRL